MWRFQEVHHVLSHNSSLNTCFIPHKKMSQEQNMVVVNRGAHHNLMKPSEVLPDIACWDDMFVQFVLLIYFYLKCLNKDYPACVSCIFTPLCLSRNWRCFLALCVVAGDDDRDTDLFLCDTNTCKFDGECLRIGDIITCICNFKVRPHALWTRIQVFYSLWGCAI